MTPADLRRPTHMIRWLRPLLRRPAFTLPAIAGLAIGIGATTAVFSVFSTMMLQSMGVRDTSRVAAVWLTDPAHGQQQVELSYSDWRALSKAFDIALASSVNLDFPLTFNGLPEHVDSTTVTGNFFEVLGVTPLAGRFLNSSDDQPGAPARIVLSYGLWRSRFGGDYSVIGRQFQSGNSPVTVIGIARPEFDFPRDVQVWTALKPSWPDVEKNAELGVFRSVARVGSMVGATASANVALRQSDAIRPPGTPKLNPSVIPILTEIYGSARPAVLILMVAVLLVLCVACANAANLMLARFAERKQEIAIRSALGAGRRQLIRLLLSESAVIAVAAGVVGLGIAQAGIVLLRWYAPPELPGMDQVSLNGMVLAVSVGLTALTVLLFGAGPAFVSTRPPRTQSPRAVRPWLIAGEVALSVMLVVTAGLLVRSFSKLSAIDPGFNPERVLTFRLTTQLPDRPAWQSLYTQVLERVRALPGVESAGAVLIRPLSGAVGWDTKYTIEEGETNPNGNFEVISPAYFHAMRIRMLAGRDFDASDNEQSVKTVIINESTANRHWPHGNAVGHRLRLGSGPKAPSLTVVGVVEDVRYHEWEAARPDFYVPLMQRALFRSDFVVKTHGDPWALAAAVRRAVFETDKTQPVSNVTTMDSLVERTLARARMSALSLASLAGCGMLLAVIGIYGLLSYAVEQRTREIGIRTALGATRGNVARVIVSEVLWYAGGGFLAGAGAAVLAASVTQSLLFQVTPADPLTYLATALIMAAIASLACAVPAWRAASIDPAAALRS